VMEVMGQGYHTDVWLVEASKTGQGLGWKLLELDMGT